MAHAHGHDHGTSEAPLTSVTTHRVLAGMVGAVVLVALVGLLLLWPKGERPILAAELGVPDEIVDATVTATDIVPCAGTEEQEPPILCRDVAFRVTEGSSKGDESTYQTSINEASVQPDEGDEIRLAYQPQVERQFQYYFIDYQRETPLLLLAALFVVAVIALGRWQGVRALLGLGVTGVVMVAFLFPSILDGNNPTAVALVAAVAIGLVALYLTHGINERTTVALLGTFGALALTALLAAVFSSAAHFTGFATEDAFYLVVASTRVDIAGLVLAGIIIGSLGVLDDVTVTQVSAVWQLHQADPTAGPRRLYGAAVTIGRDHIASTVNTLVLAYAGASLPLLLLYTQAGQRLTDVATGELVAVEIVRTLVGSIGLVAAVPLTTALAAVVITRGSLAPARPQPGGRPVAEGAAPSEPTIVAPEPEVPDEVAVLDEDEGWERFAPEEPEGW